MGHLTAGCQVFGNPNPHLRRRHRYHLHADTISDSRSNGYTFGYSRAGCDGHTYRYILANARTDDHSATRGDGDANPHFNVHTGVAIYRPSIDWDGDIEVKVKRA
jgi:hypothetical protein